MKTKIEGQTQGQTSALKRVAALLADMAREVFPPELWPSLFAGTFLVIAATAPH
jgi:hypothetical protein